MCCESVNWIQLAQHKVKCDVITGMVIAFEHLNYLTFKGNFCNVQFITMLEEHN
jgi:hypothetical protein